MKTNNMKRLKSVPLKEEFVALTGDAISALVMQQMLYWTERTRDFDAMLDELGNDSTERLHGWIFKSSQQLSEELFGIATPKTIRVKMRGLVDMGFFQERTNPRNNWDKTKQYRPCLRFINRELVGMGYHLSGYKFDYVLINNEHVQSNEQNVQSTKQGVQSSEQNVCAIPEITTQNTLESTLDEKNETHSSPHSLRVQNMIDEIDMEKTERTRDPNLAIIFDHFTQRTGLLTSYDCRETAQRWLATYGNDTTEIVRRMDYAISQAQGGNEQGKQYTIARLKSLERFVAGCPSVDMMNKKPAFTPKEF